MDEIIKKCRCGKTYTHAQWNSLEHVGEHKFPWGEILELRNCSCASTLTYQLVEGAPESELNLPVPHV